MPYMVDGHNLIGKLKGISLKSMDDELQLIELLQQFYRVSRRSLDVYFDGAPVEQAGKRSYGMVTAYFVRQGIEADTAMIMRLRKLGRRARNWVVVTSDHRIQSEARAQHARVITSEEFATQLNDIPQMDSGGETASSVMDPDELNDWLDLFNSGKKDESKDG
jgi:predicted RNA-binding protein with PIN domain